MWIREACWWPSRLFLIQIDISLFFHDQLRGYMSHSTTHHPHEGHKTCKVCTSPHSDEHRSSHLGVCHTCWYKILIVIFIIMIAISYVAWFGILWIFFHEKKDQPVKCVQGRAPGVLSFSGTGDDCVPVSDYNPITTRGQFVDARNGSRNFSSSFTGLSGFLHTFF